MTRLSLATNRKFKRMGEWKTEVMWHTVVLFGTGLANLCENHVNRGTRLAIQGRLSLNEWTTDDGEKRKTTEVHVDQFGGQVNLEGGKPKAGGGERTNPAGPREPAPEVEFDDDIPF